VRASLACYGLRKSLVKEVFGGVAERGKKQAPAASTESEVKTEKSVRGEQTRRGGQGLRVIEKW